MVATKAAKAPGAAGKAPRTHGNRELTTGVYRYSKSVMYRKKAVYKFVGKKTAKQVIFFFIPTLQLVALSPC